MAPAVCVSHISKSNWILIVCHDCICPGDARAPVRALRSSQPPECMRKMEELHGNKFSVINRTMNCEFVPCQSIGICDYIRSIDSKSNMQFFSFFLVYFVIFGYYYYCFFSLFVRLIFSLSYYFVGFCVIKHIFTIQNDCTGICSVFLLYLSPSGSLVYRLLVTRLSVFLYSILLFSIGIGIGAVAFFFCCI